MYVRLKPRLFNLLCMKCHLMIALDSPNVLRVRSLHITNNTQYFHDQSLWPAVAVVVLLLQSAMLGFSITLCLSANSSTVWWG